jgi:hypothetical protein
MKIKKLLLGGSVLVLTTLLSNQAYAWGSTWMGTLLEQIITSARGGVGQFRYNASLQIDSAGYDSDIFFGMLGKSVPDYTFSAGPDVQVFLPLKEKLVFEILDSPRYVFYAKTDQERTFNNAFSGNMHIVFDRVYFQAGGELIDVKQRLSSELSINVRLKEDILSGLVFWQASRETSFALQYRRSRYRYENPSTEFPGISTSLNRTDNLVNLMAYLQQRSRARFSLQAQYGSYVFSEEVARYKDSRSYGIFGGVEFLPPEGGYEGQTSGVRGIINVGYKYFDVIDPLQKDYSGLAGNAGIALGIFKLTALRLFFSRGPQFSTYSGVNYYVQTACGVGLSRSLSRHMLFTYDFAYGRSDYPAEEVSDGASQVRSADRYLTHAFTVSYRVLKDLEVSLLADLGRRHSKLAPRPVSDRYFIGISLTYGAGAGRISLPAGPAI